MKRLLLLATALVLSACAPRLENTYLSATGFDRIVDRPGPASPTRRALENAERKARNQILADTLGLRFQNGVTLEDAVIRDPFIRAKVYDTIRTARISDRTVNDDGNVSVTVELNRKRLLEITTRYNPEP